ncbi:MAG: hypothetical protein GY778_19850 [bacterium]|nr:hypothetical protein [bacterium]
MASLYKRGRWFWVSYFIGGKQYQKALKTKVERLARSKLKRIEYELVVGDLKVASRLPIQVVLEHLCEQLRVTRTFKSYKNDVSRLRIFFGPLCEALRPGLPGSARRTANPQRAKDK